MDTNKQVCFEPYVVSVVPGELVILYMWHWTVVCMRSSMYYSLSVSKLQSEYLYAQALVDPNNS